MGLTHEAVKRELTKVLCHQERWWREGWGSRRTCTARAVFPTPPSPSTATRQQSISGEEGRSRWMLGERVGVKQTLITMDGENGHGNLSGGCERRGNVGDWRGVTCDESRRRILKRQGRKGNGEME